jgi:hypothetical protein
MCGTRGTCGTCGMRGTARARCRSSGGLARCRHKTSLGDQRLTVCDDSGRVGARVSKRVDGRAEERAEGRAEGRAGRRARRGLGAAHGWQAQRHGQAQLADRADWHDG